MSPIDKKNWVTPERNPATDPQLLPGQLTGTLRVECGGARYRVVDGPFDALAIELTVHNHGAAPVRLDEMDEVDLQVWTPEGKVLAAAPVWSSRELPAGASREVTATVSIVDGQPVDRVAVGHRSGNGGYVFFALDLAGHAIAR